MRKANLDYKRFGIFVRHLGHSQLSFNLAKNINERSRNEADINCNIFYEDLKPYAFPPMTPVFQGIEVNGFEAPVVATSLSNTFKLINSFGPTKKFFYVWNLEWIIPQIQSYEYMSKVYCSKEIEIIARNNDHVDIIKNCWNRQPIGVVEDFNLKQLIECMGL